MHFKTNVWWLALLAFTTFLASGIFVVSTLATYATETFAYRYGATTSAYNWSDQRILNSEGQCLGLWTCWDNLCQLASLPGYKFSAITPLVTRLNDSNGQPCEVGVVSSLNWLWQWDTTKSAFICLAVAIAIDIIAITMFIINHNQLISTSQRFIYITLMTLGPALLLVSHVCAYMTMRVIIWESGDAPPTFVIVWQTITSGMLMIAVIISHGLLHIPRRVYYEDY